MPNFIPPAAKSEGQTLNATTDWNPAWAALASYLNNGGIGNSQFSSDPSERLAGSKVDLGGGVSASAHASRHEPGGADEVHDIDILNTGTLLSAHAARHASGGADPLPAGSISQAMLAFSAFGDANLLMRKHRQAWLAKNLGLTLDSGPHQTISLSSSTAQPVGQGVVRNGKVYFGCVGNDTVVEVDFSTGSTVDIAFISGDDPRSLLLVGTDIYVLCSGSKKIKKIDISNVVTTVVAALNVAPCDTNMDYAEGMCPNSDGTVVFISYKVVGQVNPTHVARVALTGTPGPTHDFSSGQATSDIGVPHFIKRGAGSDEFVVFVDTFGTGLLYRRLASNLSAVDTLVFDHNRAVYDGNLLVVAEAAGANIRLVNPWTMKEVGSFAMPGGIGIDSIWARDAIMFDGRACFFGARTTGSVQKPCVVRIPVPNYGGGIVMQVEDPGANVDASGFATDGSFLYVALGSTTGQSKILRTLL